MKQFYQQVFLDEATLRFAAVCASCGKRAEAGRLPMLCREKSRFADYAAGNVGGMRQKLYDQNFSRAVQYLVRFFNRCSACEAWVCDDCFRPNESRGVCERCADEQHGTPLRQENE